MSLNKIDGIDAAVNAIAPMQLPPPDDGITGLLESLRG
jgi:phage terminase large subunit-like protein